MRSSTEQEWAQISGLFEGYAAAEAVTSFVSFGGVAPSLYENMCWFVICSIPVYMGIGFLGLQ